MLYHALSAPITVQVELTTGCNNNCLYCYNHWRHDKSVSGANMHMGLLSKVIECLIDSKVFQVTFTGGEVLLRRKELFYGLEKLIQAGISCAVNSNLRLVTPQDAARFYQLGLRGVMTSVCSYNAELHDHISQISGAHESTMCGIQTMQNAGLFVAVSMVVTKLNAADVYPTGCHLHKQGIRQFFATKASPPVNARDFQRLMITPEELKTVLHDLYRLQNEHGMDVGILECYPLCAYHDAEKYRFASQRRCSAGITTCTIGADGAIRPCSHSDEVHGNIAQDGFIAAWKSMQKYRDGSLIPKACQSCKLFAECSGGCRVDAKYCGGIYTALDPYSQPSSVHEVILPKLVFPEVLHRMRVNTLCVREEEIGVLCASAATLATPALLTHDTHRVLKELSKDSFCAEDLVCRYGVTMEDSQRLCSMFLRDGIVRAVDN